MAKEREFPPTSPSPPALTITPDCTLSSARSLAGPLRVGTAPGVGPRRQGNSAGFGSDFGVDRMEQRQVDSIGVKYPETDRPVTTIAREGRRRR